MPSVAAITSSLFSPLGSALAVTFVMALIAGLTENVRRGQHKWPHWNIGMSLALSGLAFCVTSLVDYLRTLQDPSQRVIIDSIEDALIVLFLAILTFVVILILMALSQSYDNRGRELKWWDVAMLNLIGSIPLAAAAYILWS